MPKIPTQRALFSMLKIARGQQIRGYTGSPVLLFSTHYTTDGSRLCDRDTEAGCQWCKAKTSKIRTLALVPIRNNENKTQLFIASGSCLFEFEQTEDLENATINIARAKNTNLLRVTKIGPSNPFVAPTARWAATFFGTEIQHIEAHKCRP